MNQISDNHIVTSHNYLFCPDAIDLQNAAVWYSCIGVETEILFAYQAYRDGKSFYPRLCCQKGSLENIWIAGVGLGMSDSKPEEPDSILLVEIN